MTQRNMHYCDRSRAVTQQSCPRLRWDEYHAPNGTEIPGLRPAKMNMNFLTGGAFHEGVNVLLEIAKRAEDKDPSPAYMASITWDLFIELAVDHALNGNLQHGGKWEGFWPLVNKAGLILENSEDGNYVANEQAAMIEALVRGYQKFVLPQLLSRFRVVEAERDEYTIMEGEQGFKMIWGMRADALLLERTTDDIYVLSLKTAKEFGAKDMAGMRHDMQGISECYVVQQRLQGWQERMVSYETSLRESKEQKQPPPFVPTDIPIWFQQRFHAGGQPVVMGVKMEYAIKGRRSESPQGSSRYIYSNPLINPWKKADDLGGDQSATAWAIKYEFEDAMGGKHRLGKGWRRVNIWEDMGVKAWIDFLERENIQDFGPMTGLSLQFVLPEEVYRVEEDVERWVRQVTGQEQRVEYGLYRCKIALASGDLKKFQEELDRFFPMHTRSCDWPVQCTQQEVCFGAHGGAYLFDPMSSGLFAPRRPNHQAEMISLGLVQIEGVKA